jgi:hypothetical protein
MMVTRKQLETIHDCVQTRCGRVASGAWLPARGFQRAASDARLHWQLELASGLKGRARRPLLPARRTGQAVAGRAGDRDGFRRTASRAARGSGGPAADSEWQFHAAGSRSYGLPGPGSAASLSAGGLPLRRRGSVTRRPGPR